MKEVDPQKLFKKERVHTDSSLDSERGKTDESLLDIIETVPEVKGPAEKALNETLAREREQTDETLTNERVKTDSEVERFSNLLAEEKEAHEETRVALTTRDELLAIVSHDLRNPVGSIRSYAELISEDPSFAAASGEVHEWMEVIERNAETALSLINDILDMEMFAAGKLRVEIAPFDVAEIVAASVKSFAVLAEERKLRLTMNPSSGESLIANCDRARTMQILSNLIGNALRYTPAGGSVSVGVERHKGGVKVTVADSGPGIPEDKLEQIFERYAQLKNSQRRGLGLGLYIARMLAEAQRGRLWVTSKRGEGSSFSFTLPGSN